MINRNSKISDIVNIKNKKIVFTPGPGSLLEENILGLAPYFGRGDEEYSKIEKKVLNSLKIISGLKKIVPFQGSGSLAIEIALQNFVRGKILIVHTGYYSERLNYILKSLKHNFNNIKKIEIISWKEMNQVNKKYDWICASPVETSIGLKVPIIELNDLKNKCKSKLMIDATGSIGLESGHNFADVATFSSCKGLFGLTGGAFIAYKTEPKNKVKSFYMDINTHIEKKITGPYHTIGSLYYVLKKHHEFKNSVKINKLKFLKDNKNSLIYPLKNQPLLCTYSKIKYKNKKKNIIIYRSRKKIDGTVVSHLGELYLKNNSKGIIQKNLLK
jgi:2-aminoethylphosphonate-pyruvate transaminase